MDIKVLDLLNKYGSLTAIPAEELGEMGMKLAKSHDGVVKIVPIEDVDYIDILKRYKNRLCAYDWEVLNQAAEGSINIPKEHLQNILTRADKLVLNRIPAFQNPALFGKLDEIYKFGIHDSATRTVHSGSTEHFVQPDLVIKLCGGTYNDRYNREKKDAVYRSHGQNRHYRCKLCVAQPATVFEIHQFLERAFVDGKVRPEALGELRWHVHLMKIDDYDKFERVLRGHSTTLAYLGRAFKNYPTQQKEYVEWNGDLEVVHEEGWYSQYTPAVAEEIAASYFDHIRSLARDEFSEATLFRMCCTFPTLSNTPHELIGDLKYKIHRSLVTRDFSRIPTKYLVGHGNAGTKLESMFKKELRRSCITLAVNDDRRLWTPHVEVAKAIGVPGPVFEDIKLLSILNEARILSVELMDNTAFRQVFSTRNGLFANQRLFLDHSHTADLNPANYDVLCSKVRNRAEQIGLKRVR